MVGPIGPIRQFKYISEHMYATNGLCSTYNRNIGIFVHVFQTLQYSPENKIKNGLVVIIMTLFTNDFGCSSSPLKG